MELKQPLNRLGALAAAGAVGVAGALAFAAPGQANDHTDPAELKSAHQDTYVDSDEFPQICGESEHIPDEKPDDYDGWVFLLPNSQGETFESVIATFEEPGGDTSELEATVVSPGESGQEKHAYVGTPEGWKLKTAKAEITGAKKDEPVFNVTHACPADGVPDDDQSTPPGDDGSTPPGDDQSTPPGGDETTPGEETTSPGEASTSPAGDELPTTGAPLTVALVSAAALAATGAALFFVMRRRRATESW
ncbi:LPXTG cell wall anchor domain-containing protein [Glycomyces xiaoerkulensis]|uniref:LPXTG cell wall anchor domain-containing protein n=1 Tax=Glycomyces xiaoerkulensis TaxID=2038139 RepID=UPI000C2578A6|nr:LPXTG cell wall anchor domain-containing protein [Glycomyces xiaoerkulensis]